MTKHYSVRQSVQRPQFYKVVLAGGMFGYSNIDLPLYKTFDEAAIVANRLNQCMNKGE